MNEQDFPPLGPELERLIDGERMQAPESSAMRGRLLQRLEFTIGPMASWGSQSMSSPGGGAAQPGETQRADTHVDPSQHIASPPAAASVVAKFVAFASKPSAVAALSLGVGAAFGAGVHAAYEHRKGGEGAETVFVTARPAHVPVVAMIASAEPSIASAVAPVPTAPVPVGSGRRDDAARVEERPAAKDAALASEMVLVEMARSALTRGDSSAALAALDRHRSEFPQGALREERESLAIQALAASGNPAQARVRAKAFRQAFPGSLQADAIEQVVSGQKKITEP